MPNIKYDFKGYIQNSELLAYCKSNPFHLFVNVSESEGVPVSIMEALSFGTPVAATAVGGTPEIVFHGKNGFLLPVNTTPVEIAKVFRKFYTMSNDEYNAFRNNARKTWSIMCNSDEVYPIFYESLIKNFFRR